MTAPIPNILWITTHDINPHLGTYAGIWPGAQLAVTPNLDRLAAEGVRYNQAFATTPVCAPSRSSVITGCYPTSIGTMHMRSRAVPPPEIRLLPQYFRENGYYTTNNYFTDLQMEIPAIAFDDISPTAHWRDRPSRDTPFFAQFHGGITHESKIYQPDKDFLAATSHVTDKHNPSDIILPPYHPDTAVFRKAWARYLDLITEMDHWVGTLLQELEQDGLADNTIVVFWSDHGLGMPRAKRWAHEAGLREPLIMRWPSMIPPGSARNEIVSLIDIAPTMLTLAGLDVPSHMQGVSLIHPDGTFNTHPHDYVFGGRDRMDEQEDTVRTVRSERYRLIHNLHPDRSSMQYCFYPDHYDTWAEFRRLYKAEATSLATGDLPTLLSELQRRIIGPTKPDVELYDITSDPHEQFNLANDPNYRDTLDTLMNALSSWRSQMGDLGDIPESELVEEWRPGGVLRKTEAPEYWFSDRLLHVKCSTPGAVVGWTIDEPRVSDLASRVDQAELRRLGIEADGRRWHPYTGPFTPPPGPDNKITLRAWRIGYEPSRDTPIDIPSQSSDTKKVD